MRDPHPASAPAHATADVQAEDEQARLILADCLAHFGVVRLRVTGECMLPALHPGDTVEIVPVLERRPGFGDIVLFRHPNGLRLHRLVWGPPRGRSFWRLKADRAIYWDPAVPAGALLGVVVSAADPDGRPRTLPRLSAACWSLARTLVARLGGTSP